MNHTFTCPCLECFYIRATARAHGMQLHTSLIAPSDEPTRVCFWEIGKRFNDCAEPFPHPPAPVHVAHVDRAAARLSGLLFNERRDRRVRAGKA